MSTNLTRRDFLVRTAAATGLTAATGWAQTPPLRAPFRVLYSNDLTNILSCTSPWHKPRQPLTDPMIEATVDEVAGTGVDVHLLQPGLGWIPWWKSKIYPAEEHYRWVQQRTGAKPDAYGKYMLEGGDVLKPFIARCREKGQAPFVSLRMNDAHHLEFANEKNSHATSVSRFYLEHPEYRLGPDPLRSGQLVLNWAIPEVRAQKLAFIREICENYDIDGFEMDFMRFCALFQQDKTTREQRCGIMTAFVRQVREILDRTARRGQRRWLCARVPCLLKGLDALGLDVRELSDTGLDMVNVSAFYYTTQHTEFAAIRKLAPQAAMYLEMCHTIWNGPKLVPGYDTSLFRRATDEQFYTTAHLAYARGADGMSLFNFAYYREFGSPGRGPFSEPPFHVLKRLGDRAWLAQQPQHFFLAQGWNNPFERPALLPRTVAPNKPLAFNLDFAPPAGGWKKEGRLRIQTEKPVGDAVWMAKLNSVELPPNADVTEPFPNPSPVMLGTPEEHRAFRVPTDALKDGPNRLELVMSGGNTASLVFIDVALG
jgi:hypothetical protein